MTPKWEIKANATLWNQDLSQRIDSIELHDVSDGQADTLVIELDDYDNRLPIPPKGAELGLHIGFAGLPLHNKGLFTVDEIEHSGPPDRLIITARSADFRADFRTLKNAHWEAGTLLTVLLASVAERYGLASIVHPSFAGISLAQVNQSDESDSALLKRLGLQYDATATVKNGRLLFLPKGTGSTASGQILPTAIITRSECVDHSFKTADRDSRYTGVTAFWYDNNNAKRTAVVAGEEGYTKQMRDTLPDAQQATESAEAEWRRIQRGKSTMRLTVAPGRPELSSGTPCSVQGWKADIDSGEWVIDVISHKASSGGLVTSVELVTKG